jgi:hypothetical protein
MILLFLAYKLDAGKNELKENKESYKITKNMVIELTSLKDTYTNKINIKKSLQRILGNSFLRSSKIIKKFKNSAVTISSEGMDIKALNLLMNKLINNSYDITSLNIKRLSDRYVSLKMEIKW